MQQASPRSKWSLLPLAGFLVAAIVLGCGGSGGSSKSGGGLTSGSTSGSSGTTTGGTTSTTGGTTGTTSGGSSGGTITDDQRMAALDAVQAKAESLPHKDLPADNAAMYAYLQTRPEFEEVGTGQLCSWARFKDGRLLIVYNNMPAPDKAALAASSALRSRLPKSNSAQTRLVGGSFPGDVPESTQARALNGLGSIFDTQNQTIEKMWEDVGYNVLNKDTSQSEKDATLENLYNVKGDGAFLYTTHGGSAKAKDKQKVFCLLSATDVSKANDLAHKAELDAGEMAYSCAMDDEIVVNGQLVWTYPKRYSITDRFIRKHWHFSPGSLVYLGCCFGYDETLRSAVMAVGAENYFGWTESSDIVVAVAANYVFSRATGTDFSLERSGNGHEYGFGSPTPPNRAFSYEEIYGGLANLGLTKCLSTYPNEPPSQLMYAYKDMGFGQLAPSIYHLQPNEELHQLSITGRFGGIQGTVTIGGTPVTVKTWAPAMIVTSLPDSGAGASGDVVVSVKGHPSNKARLTMWSTVIHYRVKGPGTLFQKADFNISWRGDARKIRTLIEAPAEGLDFATVPTYVSTVNYDIGGTYNHGDGCVETWEATQPSLIPRVSATSFWSAPIQAYTDDGQSTLAPSAQVGNGWKTTMTCNGQSSSQTLAFTTYFKKLVSEWDEKLGEGPYQSTTTTNTGTITWSWEGISAVNPPDDQAAS